MYSSIYSSSGENFQFDECICTQERNRLQIDQLDAIMRVCKEGSPDLSSDDLDELVEIFKTEHTRKLSL